jgi:hypothetical protein
MQGAPNGTVMAKGGVPIGREGGPLTSPLAMRPQTIGKYARSTTHPFYTPPHFKSSGAKTNSRDGTDFRGTRGRGPIAATSFAPEPEIRDFPDHPVNTRVVYARLCRKFRNDINSDVSMMYQLVISKKDDIPEKTTRRGRPGEHTRRYSVMTVPMWNYIQQRAEPLYNPSDPKRPRIKTAEEVWSKFTLDGVGVSEEGQEDVEGFFEEGKERLVNFVARGPAYIHNTWGNDIDAGTSLFLILKKPEHDLDGSYALRPKGVELSTIDLYSQLRTYRPFQLYYYANSAHSYPPDEEMEYYDEDGVLCTGKAIYVGKVDEARRCQNMSTLSQCNKSVPATLNQPQMWIMVDSNDNEC